MRKLILASLMFVLATCGQPPAVTERDLIGQWNFADTAQELTLNLNADHTYTKREAEKPAASMYAVISSNLTIMLLPDSGAWRLTTPTELRLQGPDGTVIIFHIQSF